MESEIKRLSTFIYSVHSTVSVVNLARRGYMCLPNGLVVCAFCFSDPDKGHEDGCEYPQYNVPWTINDTVSNHDYIEWGETKNTLQGVESTNLHNHVVAELEFASQVADPENHRPEEGNLHVAADLQIENLMKKEKIADPQKDERPTKKMTEEQHRLKIFEALNVLKRPCSSKYADPNNRYTSFDHLQVQGSYDLMHKHISDFVDAGFYYSQSGREVRCYHCGGSLSGFTDFMSVLNYSTPLEYHVKVFGDCYFAKQKLLHTREGDKSSSYQEIALDSDSDIADAYERMCSNMQSMRHRLDELLSNITCKLCLTAKVEHTFAPCGHLCVCSECSEKIRECPLCRQTIIGAIRTYL